MKADFKFFLRDFLLRKSFFFVFLIGWEERVDFKLSVPSYFPNMIRISFYFFIY